MKTFINILNEKKIGFFIAKSSNCTLVMAWTLFCLRVGGAVYSHQSQHTEQFCAVIKQVTFPDVRMHRNI